MLHYHRIEVLHYQATDLFKLVIDVENYPKFVPWCVAARIVERQPNMLRAELLVKFKGIIYKYVSLIKFQEFELISIEQFSGPFAHLNSKWQFSEIEAHKTKLELAIDFSFKSSLLNKLSQIFFNSVSKRMSDAFIKRAQELYGQNKI
jgi:coenzyme Q-binding protein COQ10